MPLLTDMGRSTCQPTTRPPASPPVAQIPPISWLLAVASASEVWSDALEESVAEAAFEASPGATRESRPSLESRAAAVTDAPPFSAMDAMREVPTPPHLTIPCSPVFGRLVITPHHPVHHSSAFRTTPHHPSSSQITPHLLSSPLITSHHRPPPLAIPRQLAGLLSIEVHDLRRTYKYLTTLIFHSLHLTALQFLQFLREIGLLEGSKVVSDRGEWPTAVTACNGPEGSDRAEPPVALESRGNTWGGGRRAGAGRGGHCGEGRENLRLNLRLIRSAFA